MENFLIKQAQSEALNIQKKALEITGQVSGKLDGKHYKIADSIIDGRKEISKNKQRLLELEKEGKYVFHGSLDDINVLEPRQAHNTNEITGEEDDDGEPAVCATPYAEIAIFRALTADLTSKFGINDNLLHYATDGKLYKEVEARIGKVYVLDKSDFKYMVNGEESEEIVGMECRCKNSVTPIEIIEVNIHDLPEDIKIIPSGKKY